VGNFDSVPAVLTPGEHVSDKKLTQGLQKMVDNGPSGNTIHVHGVSYAPEVHALDADGVDEVLTKHADTFHKHFENSLRKLNR
jgi:hypothetical protein